MYDRPTYSAQFAFRKIGTFSVPKTGNAKLNPWLSFLRFIDSTFCDLWCSFFVTELIIFRSLLCRTPPCFLQLLATLPTPIRAQTSPDSSWISQCSGFASFASRIRCAFRSGAVARPISNETVCVGPRTEANSNKASARPPFSRSDVMRDS